MKKSKSTSGSLAPGDLLERILKGCEDLGIQVVYLRNHENFPHDLGNDVDLLFRRSTSVQALAWITEVATANGWEVLYSVQFSPLSLFLSSLDFDRFLHIDLFERLEWHSIEYADAEAVLRGAVWNGHVLHPSPGDEVFLNVSTRLIYHGAIREKHRLQARELLEDGRGPEILNAFRRHLGSTAGTRVGNAVINQDWETAKCMGSLVRRNAVFRYGLMSPRSAISGSWRYLRRAAARIAAPPGPFIVFEGADGVGKSTLIEGMLPLMKDLTGRTDAILFHWKPTRASIRLAGEAAGPARDPRGRSTRSIPASIFYLAYHWMGFWAGYLRHVLPARAKNCAVLGDRYSYEFFLDPARLRLRLPDWMARMAAASVPRPDLVICLVAPPAKVYARKPELNIAQIREYQSKLEAMTEGDRTCVLLRCDGSIEQVILDARALILKSLFSNRK